MNKYKKMALNKTKIGFIVFFSLFLILIAFNNYFMYDATIGKIVTIEEIYEGAQENHGYSEKYYSQNIIAVFKNGDHKGEKVNLSNRYGESQVYDDKFSTGNDVFIGDIKKNNGLYSGTINGQKRDQYVSLTLVVLVSLLVLVGGGKGLLVAGSLAFNLLCFYYVLKLYEQGTNLLIMMIPLTILFSIITLYFIGGWSKMSLAALSSTLMTVVMVTGISAIILHFHDGMDYDFMEYLPQPYEQHSANIIFLSEILIGSLGAVMDVSVTIASMVKELVRTSAGISTKEIITSCRKVGDDLIGTMINVMFFTNVACGLPFFVLSLRNGIMFTTILRYHLSFEIARFLTGSLGIVLSIPISIFFAIWIYGRKREK